METIITILAWTWVGMVAMSAFKNKQCDHTESNVDGCADAFANLIILAITTGAVGWVLVQYGWLP